MNAKGLLDQLLNTGQSLMQDGLGKAENKLNIPAQGKERDAMLSGMGKGAAVAGVLGLLLGTKKGRKLGGTAAKIGGIAALGTFAYKAYQEWQKDDNSTQPNSAQSPKSLSHLNAQGADERSLILLRAMVSAAKADGHIDDAERAAIQSQITELGLDTQAMSIVQNELNLSVDAHKIASYADSMESATEIYLVSRIVIDQTNEMEQAYLDELARALQLPPALRNTLEKHVQS